MKARFRIVAMWFAGMIAYAVCQPVHAVTIVNGGFDAGFTGWTRVDQLGSQGTFFLQTGTASPVNGNTVPAPPQGTTAAMTDAQGPGSHVLFQDFVVTTPVTPTALNFSLFVGNRGTAFFTPNTLDFSTPALNQRARVDILRAGTDPFSLAAADVLANLFETRPGDPLVSGYTLRSLDVTSLINANAGSTLRLRFSEVDNVNVFQFGVDNVSFSAVTAVSEPASSVLAISALLGVIWTQRRRKLTWRDLM